MLKQRGGGGGVAVNSQGLIWSASSQDCGSCHGSLQWTLRFWFWDAGIHQRDRASSATCLHQIHACCPTHPQALGASFGLLFAFRGAHSLPARTRTRPAGSPHVVQTRFPAGGPVKGPGSRQGGSAKPGLLSRWKDSGLSWSREMLRHPAAVRRNSRPKDASYQDFSCISSASAPAPSFSVAQDRLHTGT